MNARAAERGFTLLEVLVGLSVMALGAALTLSLISSALGNIRKVQVRTRTIQHAETVMELTLLDASIRQPTTLQGDFEDGTRWRLLVDEWDPPRPLQAQLQQPPRLPVKMLTFSVEVYSPGSSAADFRLQTLKLINVRDSRFSVEPPPLRQP